MPKLTPLKANEVMRKLRALGYDGPIPGAGTFTGFITFRKKSFRFPLMVIKILGLACYEKSYTMLM